MQTTDEEEEETVQKRPFLSRATAAAARTCPRGFTRTHPQNRNSSSRFSDFIQSRENTFLYFFIQSKIRQASPPKRITPLEEKVAEIVANEKKKRSPYEASSPASSSKKKGQSNGRSRRKVRLRLRPPTAAGAAATADSSAATSSNASATKEDNSSDGEVVVVIRGGDSNGKLAGERVRNTFSRFFFIFQVRYVETPPKSSKVPFMMIKNGKKQFMQVKSHQLLH